ncbi:MAG: sensor histidine kinase [Chitinophagaceae bacterium]
MFSFHNNRYTFWKVFWIVVAINAVLQLLGFGVLAIVDVPDQPFKVEDFLTLEALLQIVVSTLFNVIFYYFTLNVYHNFLIKKYTWQPFVVYSLKVFSICIAYYFLFNWVFAKSIKKLQNNTKTPIGLQIFSYVFATLFLIGVSLLLSYLNYLRDQSRQRKVLERQKIKLEVEKLQADYQFLKAQINPHFLHNTLNFFYAKSLPYSEELSDGILTLSEIMRYALSKPETPDGKVLLSHEIDHLRNVIKINQLRFSNNLNVNFTVSGIIGETTIIPFVLITIVENAFKHGDLKNADHPIEIQLVVNDSQLYFFCRNRKKSGPKELSTGIGLENTQKRLALTYGKNYRFEVHDDTDFFTTELTLFQL